MASSWFLVLIPTRKYESQLRTILGGGDNSEDKTTPGISHIVVDENTGEEYLDDTLPISPILRNKPNLLKHQNTEESHKSSVKFTFDNSRFIIDTTSDTEAFDEDPAYFEADLEEALKVLNVLQATYQLTKSGNFYLVSFYIDASDVEVALMCLQERGIGNTEFTSISVIPTSVHLIHNPVGICSNVPVEEYYNLERSNVASDTPDLSDSANNTLPTTDETILSKGKEARRSSGPTYINKKLQEQKLTLQKRVDTFYSSVKSRMIVTEVVNGIRAGGEFTFDYLLLVVLASIIAFLGLLENSSVVLVASMLVSPIMGPILAGVFGFVIGDNKLRNRGIQHEVISIGICIIVGFVCGLFFCLVGVDNYYQKSMDKWPTPEMTSRGNGRSLFIGILVAIPSGMGVALSVLGGNMGSLVGVAISASLLPPAINAGFYWSIALVAQCTWNETYVPGWNSTTYKVVNGTNGSYEIVEEYPDTYEWSRAFPNVTDHTLENFPADAAIKGFFSLLLTLVNIACIIATGVIILRIKEVTSDKIPQQFGSFWTEHVKNQREFNKLERKSTTKIRKNKTTVETEALLEEVRDVLDIGDSEEDGLEDTFLHTLFEKARNDTDYKDVLRVTGMESVIPSTTAQLRRKSHRLTVANLNDLRRMSKLDAMEGANEFELKANFANRTSKVFDESEENKSEDMSTDILFKQAKMIQRSRTIGGGWKKRALSKKRKLVQIDVQGINNTNENANTTVDPIPEIALESEKE